MNAAGLPQIKRSWKSTTRKKPYALGKKDTVRNVTLA